MRRRRGSVPPTPSEGRVLGHVQAGVPTPIEGECWTCGFDALLHVNFWVLSAQGVSPLGSMILCGRCLEVDGGQRE